LLSVMVGYGFLMAATHERFIICTFRTAYIRCSVVDHIIMLDTYYENIQNHPLWTVVNNLYTGLVSKVKWKGNTSNSFQIHQGDETVRNLRIEFSVALLRLFMFLLIFCNPSFSTNNLFPNVLSFQ
jgi:hypothetical protein